MPRPRERIKMLRFYSVGKNAAWRMQLLKNLLGGGHIDKKMTTDLDSKKYLKKVV